MHLRRIRNPHLRRLSHDPARVRWAVHELGHGVDLHASAREYDPTTAQFLTVDPLQAITGEPYSYAGDNPVNYSNQTGLIFGIPGTPSWEEVGEGIAGWGDTITFGATKWVRGQIGDETSIHAQAPTKAAESPGSSLEHSSLARTTPRPQRQRSGLGRRARRPGPDGGISEYGKERLGGETISTAHRVEFEDEVIHQYQTHIGKYGGERQFPNEWIQFPGVGAP
jgi:RHS repeat-associated protein